MVLENVYERELLVRTGIRRPVKREEVPVQVYDRVFFLRHEVQSFYFPRLEGKMMFLEPKKVHE